MGFEVKLFWKDMYTFIFSPASLKDSLLGMYGAVDGG